MFFKSNVSKKEILRLEEELQEIRVRLNKVESEQIDILSQLKMIRDKVLRRFRTTDNKEETTNVILPTQNVGNPFVKR